MNQLPFFIILFLWCYFSSPETHASILPGTEDVIIPEAFILMPESSIIFDKPEGRIVKGQYKIPSPPPPNFFSIIVDTFLNLGWTLQKKDAQSISLIRENELLTIVLLPNTNGPYVISYNLSPWHS